MFQTILLPLDDSDHSRGVLPFATKLADITRSRIILFEAVADPALRPHAEASLENAREHLRHAGVSATCEVAIGHPVEAILYAAREHNADLVCLATRRWSDVDRWLNGSVMDAVLRHISLPLLVVPADCATLWSEPIGPVLVPLDGSALAEAVLPVATEISAALGTPLSLIRAGADTQAATSYLTDVRARIPACTVYTRVASGSPEQVIVRTAAEEQVPLIAMATHGRTGLARLALGSVATHVLQSAGVPLLLIRPAGVATPLEPELTEEAGTAEPLLVSAPSAPVVPWLPG